MPKIAPFVVIPLIPSLGFATDVFSDNFNRATPGAAYTTTVTAGDGGATLSGGAFLELTNDATASANASGRISLATAFSGFTTPFTATLAANPGPVTWETNLRYNRTTDPSGFGAGGYGLAFILGGTSADFTTGNGYAVLYGSATSPEPLRFVRYSGGLTTAGTITDLITGTALAQVNNYASLRVTFDPTAGSWSLFVRDDGASAWASPATLAAANQTGTATVDTTYTGASATLTHAGYLWNYNTTANQTAQFDNLRVTVAPAAIPEPTTAGAALAGLASAAWMRRKKRLNARASHRP